MSELNKCQSASSSALTKAYGDIGVLIAEDDHDAVVSEREHPKTMYRRFQRAHIEYHDTYWIPYWMNQIYKPVMHTLMMYSSFMLLIPGSPYKWIHYRYHTGHQ